MRRLTRKPRILQQSPPAVWADRMLGGFLSYFSVPPWVTFVTRFLLPALVLTQPRGEPVLGADPAENQQWQKKGRGESGTVATRAPGLRDQFKLLGSGSYVEVHGKTVFLKKKIIVALNSFSWRTVSLCILKTLKDCSQRFDYTKPASCQSCILGSWYLSPKQADKWLIRSSIGASFS